MFYIMKAGLFFLSVLILSACSIFDRQAPSRELHPAPPDALQENSTLYTNMHTYGQYMGCRAAQTNEGLPQGGWDQAPALPGTYEEYRNGWQEGFNKCRIGLGPVVPPGQEAAWE